MLNLSSSLSNDGSPPLLYIPLSLNPASTIPLPLLLTRSTEAIHPSLHPRKPGCTGAEPGPALQRSHSAMPSSSPHHGHNGLDSPPSKPSKPSKPRRNQPAAPPHVASSARTVVRRGWVHRGTISRLLGASKKTLSHQPQPPPPTSLDDVGIPRRAQQQQRVAWKQPHKPAPIGNPTGSPCGMCIAALIAHSI